MWLPAASRTHPAPHCSAAAGRWLHWALLLESLCATGSHCPSRWRSSWLWIHPRQPQRQGCCMPEHKSVLWAVYRTSNSQVCRTWHGAMPCIRGSGSAVSLAPEHAQQAPCAVLAAEWPARIKHAPVISNVLRLGSGTEKAEFCSVEDLRYTCKWSHPSRYRPAKSRAPSTSSFSAVRCTAFRPCIDVVEAI